MSIRTAIEINHDFHGKQQGIDFSTALMWRFTTATRLIGRTCAASMESSASIVATTVTTASPHSRPNSRVHHERVHHTTMRLRLHLPHLRRPCVATAG